MPFQIVRQDITKMKVDAIINSTDPCSKNTGGADLAILDSGGEGLISARKALGTIKTGEVKYTKGYQLPAQYVFHTVGPKWNKEDKDLDHQLYETYMNALNLAHEMNLSSIAFPLIASGFYGYPKDKALAIATEAIKAFLQTKDLMVYLAVFDKESYLISKSVYKDVKSYMDEHLVEDQYFEEIAPYLNRSVVNYNRRDPHESAPFEPQDDTWQEALLDSIKASGHKNSDVYKKVNLTRQHFSKILKNKDYHPSKPTAIAFCLALELDIDQTLDLINKAGYQLSRSIPFDLIVRFHIERRIYDIFTINEVLFEFDQELLGSNPL